MKSVRTLLIVGAISLAAVISLLLGFVLDRQFESMVRAEIVEMLLRETILVRPALEAGSMTRLQEEEIISSLGLRLTLIDATGHVMFDTNVDSARLSSVENHLFRPEIQDALHTGTGTFVRQSATTGVEQVYASRFGTFNAVLDHVVMPVAYVRLSISLADANSRVAAVRVRVVLAGVGIVLLVALVSVLFARRVLRPIIGMSQTARAIGDGDLSLRVNISGLEEIGDLGRAINAMVHKVEADIRELERLGKYRTEFLGDVSHELRTPIFAIQGSVETVLADDKMPLDVRRSFLETAMRNTARLNALVSDLIDISRIESRELRLSLRYFDVTALVHDVVTEFIPSAERKGLILDCVVPETEVSVYGDRDRLRQVIVNLTDNAVKNTEHGSVILKVELQDRFARISISDTGIGISAEHLPRIFERFYRVDKDRSRASGGTGLGLAIVKHIIEAHGGKIAVDSTIDQGSVFWFDLPL